MNEKTQVITELEHIFQRWEAYLSLLSEADTMTPQPDGLSIRDVIAHLAAWQQLTAARMAAARDGGTPVAPAWTAGLYADAEEHLEQFNARILGDGRRRAWPDVYQAWREGFLALLELARQTPESDLVDAGRYIWLGDRALIDVLRGSCEHHVEHLDGLAAGAA